MMNPFFVISLFFLTTQLTASSKFGIETVHALRSITEGHGRIEACEENESLIVVQAYVVHQETEIAEVPRAIIAQRALTTCEMSIAACFLTCYPISQSQEEQSEYQERAWAQARGVTECMSNATSFCRSRNAMQR